MSDPEEMIDIKVTLDGNLLKAVQGLAEQGYLGTTPESVIEHCLREHMFWIVKRQDRDA